MPLPIIWPLPSLDATMHAHYHARVQTVVLVGLSGTGKTTAGELLARALGRPFVDTDALIEAHAGRSIADIFAGEGEPAFRERETRALREALSTPGAVVATGGGIVETPENASLLRDAVVVWLTAGTDRLEERLARHSDRPLLAADRRAALDAQLHRRAARYAALADWIVATGWLSPEQVVAEIQRFLAHESAGLQRAGGAGDVLRVATPGGSYEVVVAAGALQHLPRLLEPLVPRGRVWVVSDDHVWPLHGDRLVSVLAGAGITPQAYQIPEGEASKNLDTVAGVYDWLLGNGVERGDLLLAFGGGVVGDLAGFVAATTLRGIPFVQLPTTVLAVVDSSIGGKTGVDHAAGKNLIGSFYQPALVLADTDLLRTLPEAERRSGWTEAIKHGVIADVQLFADLGAAAAALCEVEEPVTSRLLRRAAAVKVTTVSGDEREQGNRILLNYGHTIGHALEQWSRYTIRHGFAVAIGMCVAAAIARRIGICDPALEDEQTAVLRAFGLPVRLPSSAEPALLLQAARSDKKIRQQKMRWVLPTRLGAATVRDDVPEATVLEVLAELREGR